MKINRLRNKDGKKLTQLEMNSISGKLRSRLEESGFETEVCAYGVTSIKIGLHMKTFTINYDILGRNIRHSKWSSSLTGWKYTNIPTWEERVEFNDIVNEVLDDHEVTAKVVSGVFLVRCHIDGAKFERDWRRDDSGDCYYTNNATIEKATDEHDKERKVARRKRAKELRDQKKQFF